MQVVIRAKDIELKKEIKKFIEKKIGSLEKFAEDLFNEKYFNQSFKKGKPKIKVWVEIGKESRHHEKGPYFYAECQMSFPGKSLRAESLKEDLKTAIIEVKEELERQIKNYKKKIVAKFERGARKLKRELKISPLARKKEGKRVLKEGV